MINVRSDAEPAGQSKQAVRLPGWSASHFTPSAHVVTAALLSVGMYSLHADLSAGKSSAECSAARSAGHGHVDACRDCVRRANSTAIGIYSLSAVQLLTAVPALDGGRAMYMSHVFGDGIRTTRADLSTAVQASTASAPSRRPPLLQHAAIFLCCAENQTFEPSAVYSPCINVLQGD